MKKIICMLFHRDYWYKTGHYPRVVDCHWKCEKCGREWLEVEPYDFGI